MTLTEFVRFFGDFAEIATPFLLIHVIYKAPILVDAPHCRIRDDLVTIA